MPRYQQVQFIAYHVPTFIPTPPGRLTSTPRGPIANLFDPDARIRVQRLLDVVRWSRARALDAGHLALRDEEGLPVLKVFIAPELYFREGWEGYPHTGPDPTRSRGVIDLARALRDAFASPDFEDWLILPGTILSHLGVKRTHLKVLRNAHARVIALREPRPGESLEPRWPLLTKLAAESYFSTALVIKGGLRDRHILQFMDRLSPADVGWLSVFQEFGEMDLRDRDASLNPEYAPLSAGWRIRKERVFQLDGLWLGMENGLDHCHGRLTRLLSQWDEEEDEFPGSERESRPEVDLHLISSCGMPLNADHVCSRQGGYVLRCDGGRNEGSASSLHGGVGMARRTRAGTVVWRGDLEEAGEGYLVPRPAGLSEDDPAWFRQELVVHAPVRL